MEEKEPINNWQSEPDKKSDKGLKNLSPASAAYIGLIAVFLLYQLGGSLLSIAILGLDIKNADVNAVRLLTSAGQVLFILLPALILTKAVYVDVTSIIRLKKPDWLELILFIGGMLILMILLQAYLFIQNYLFIKLADISQIFAKVKMFFDQIDQVVEETYINLLMSNSIFESILIVIVVAIVPAVCEEVFFRGYVQRSFEFKYKAFFSALLTAIFFGIYHFHPYQVIPLIGLGFYFGFAAYKSNSIIIPVSLHFLNNFFAVIMFFIFGKDDIVNDPSAYPDEIGITVFTFIGAAVLFTLLVIFINKFYNKRKVLVLNEAD